MRRMPQVGDLIIEHVDENGHVCHRSEKKRYIGIVTDIHLDKYGHQRNVMIEWSLKSPPEYNVGWGYCGSNIHNLYNRFSLVRRGIEF